MESGRNQGEQAPSGSGGDHLSGGGGPSGGDVHCPECGKFVGAYERCPHCGAKVGSRLKLSLVRRFSVAGSIIGLVILWHFAAAKEIPVIRVGEIEPNMSNALVSVEGEVLSITFDTGAGNLRMKVYDGSGEINIGCYGKLERFLDYFGDDMPGLMDRVRVTGNLAVSESFGASIFLSLPERLEVLEYFDWDAETDIGALTEDDAEEGRVVLVRGTVRGMREFTVGKEITLDDGTGTIGMTIFNSSIDKIPDDQARRNLTRTGTRLRVLARVGSYRGNLQLQPLDAEAPGCIEYEGRS